MPKALSSWSLWAGAQFQMDHYGRVNTASSSLYQGYRYPGEIVSHRVWLYHRFPLSFREIEKMMIGHRLGAGSQTGHCQVNLDHDLDLLY